MEAPFPGDKPPQHAQTQPAAEERAFLHAAARHVACAIGAPYVRIWLVETDGTLVCAAAHGYVHERTYERRLPPESVTGLAARSGLLHLRDAPGHPHWHVSREFGTQTGLGPYLGVALAGADGPLGVIELMRASEHEFVLREVAVLQSVVEVVVRAMDMGRYGARMHQALERARRSSREASAAHARLLAVARHELRGYLARLRLQVELLSSSSGDHDTPGSPAFGVSLGRIERSIDGLTSLVDDLLRVTDDDGLGARQPDTTDLTSLTRRVTNDFAQSYAAVSRLTLRLPSRPCWVRGDQTSLERLLVNLLDNAFKYSPDGGPIRVTVECQASGASVHVADRGLGFPDDPEAQFEPFARGSNAVERGISGSGLGLFVCRQLAERFGGRTWVESPGTEGWTSVGVWLPSAGLSAF